MTESDLQRAIVMWAQTMESLHPELKWLYHIGNGGKRDAREATLLKSQGVKAGILDLDLPVARHGFHGLKIELKRPIGKCLPPSKEQKEYIEFCTKQGYNCLISNSFDEVKLTILRYLHN